MINLGFRLDIRNQILCSMQVNDQHAYIGVISPSIKTQIHHIHRGYLPCYENSDSPCTWVLSPLLSNLKFAIYMGVISLAINTQIRYIHGIICLAIKTQIRHTQWGYLPCYRNSDSAYT